MGSSDAGPLGGVSQDHINRLIELAQGDPATDKKIALRAWAAFLLMSLAAVIAITGLVWRAADDQGRIARLQEQQSCRSDLLVALDVARGEWQLALSGLVSAIFLQAGGADALVVLRSADGLLGAALDDRALTAETCGTAGDTRRREENGA